MRKKLLRFRRRLRRGQLHVEGIGSQAEQQLEKNLVKRFDRLLPIRRFVLAWVGLVALLIGLSVAQTVSLSNYYQKLDTIPGGIYNEGVRGRFTNANPMFASTDADSTVARLLFAGLLKTDEKGGLVGELARDYSVDSHGSTYTVKLKPNLTWHDGKPLTSRDVLFTFRTIQNPDTRSPLLSSWQGIEITAPDAHTVVFKLPSALAAFPHSLTTGIVPEHVLASLPATDLRSADFNTLRPVGSGPFKWEALQVDGDGDPRNTRVQIAMEPFDNYAAGEPKLQRFIVHIYANEDDMLKAFEDKKLTAIEGMNNVPKAVTEKSGVVTHDLPIRAATMVFFKVSQPVLSDKQVRQALVKATNAPEIIDQLGYPARQVRQPFLIGQLGYDPAMSQASFDLKAARDQLEAAGWLPGKDGVRAKEGKPLTFTLNAANTAENRQVTKLLQDQWRQAGAKVDIRLLDANDFQISLANHDYDAVLDGISIGIDPDVFVYWDSSQADIRSTNRLNLSEYNNATADEALEAGRTRLDPTLRALKYRPFLEAWREDAPAVGLYQPRLLYLTNGPVGGLTDSAVTVAADRFYNVQNWEVRQAKVTE